MTYIVTAYRSYSACRTWYVGHLRGEIMTWGPYKRLKPAKRKATELRKDRVEVVDRANGELRDCGPSFVNVKIVEVHGKMVKINE